MPPIRVPSSCRRIDWNHIWRKTGTVKRLCRGCGKDTTHNVEENTREQYDPDAVRMVCQECGYKETFVIARFGNTWR